MTQSDAEPVAWRYRHRVTKDHPWSNWMLMPSADGLEVCDKYPENYETQGLGVIAAPPHPDTSAGLIEAAEVMKTAELYAGRLHACLLGAGLEPPRQQWLAAHFRDAVTSHFRARAADRSAK